MAEAAKSQETNPFSALNDSTAAWNFGVQQFQVGIEAQAEFLGNLQAATESYWRHRRQNFEDAAIALRRMYECKDFGEATAIQQKWMSDVAQSLFDDFAALSRTAPARSNAPEQHIPSRAIKVTKAAS